MALARPVCEAAVAALSEALRFEQSTDGLLAQFFRRHRQLGARDRAMVSELVFGVMRHRRFLADVVRADTAQRLVLAHLALFDGKSDAELAGACRDHDQRWLERARTQQLDGQPLAVAVGWPDWLAEALAPAMPAAELWALGRALLSRAPLDLRVNTLVATREEVLLELAGDGIVAEPTPHSPIGLRLPERSAINRHPAFIEGRIEVQDEGSQLLGYLVAPKPAEVVADFCAGGGGKTLLLGALMRDQGRIYALDVVEERLRALRSRVKRAGLRTVVSQRLGADQEHRLARLHGKMDRVLVDAPCTGLGTLRRNPDLKWRVTPAAVEAHAEEQLALLSRAAELVKPGGRLVYATCSILPAENEVVVEHFLARGGFRVVSAAKILAKLLPIEGPYLRLWPHRHGTDGFFGAVMERQRV